MPADASSDSEVADAATRGQPQRFRSTRTRLCGRVTELARSRLGLIELFQRCSAGFVDMLAERVEYKVFDAGTTIIKQGDIGTCMYLLNIGEAEVLVGDQTAAKLTSGTMFGEMAAIGKDRAAAVRTASIVALTVCDCYLIDRQPLQHCLAFYPEDEAIIAAEARIRLNNLIDRGLIEDKRADKRRLSDFMLPVKPPEPEKTHWKKASRKLSSLKRMGALQQMKTQDSETEDVSAGHRDAPATCLDLRNSAQLPAQMQAEEDQSTSLPNRLESNTGRWTHLGTGIMPAPDAPESSCIGPNDSGTLERHTAPAQTATGQMHHSAGDRLHSMSSVMAGRLADAPLNASGRLCLSARGPLQPLRRIPTGNERTHQFGAPLGSCWSVGRTKAEIKLCKDAEAFLAEREIFSDDDVLRDNLPQIPRKRRTSVEPVSVLASSTARRRP